MTTGYKDYVIITKCDSAFFSGLKALINSLNIFEKNKRKIVLDCGLTDKEVDFCLKNKCEVHKVKTTKYKVDFDYYSSAIYAFFEIENLSIESEVIIFLDCDTLVLNNLYELAELAKTHNFAACTDHPPLKLIDQIKNDEGLKIVKKYFNQKSLMSETFNAGVLAFYTPYFFEKIITASKLFLPYHNLFYGNDQAVLNLAAKVCNVNKPFFKTNLSYNTRPKYRRDPFVEPLKDVIIQKEYKLFGIAGRVNILHFVGRPKPWEDEYNTDCISSLYFNNYHNIT